MTVNTTANQVTYSANGATTQWTFPFPAVDDSFILVSITDPSLVTTMVPTSQYTVTLNAPINPNPTSQGGFVTYPLVGSPLAAGNQLTITRVLPATQSVSLSNQSIVYPPVIEQEFDYLTMLQQGLMTGLNRSFRVGIVDPLPALVPPVALRANQLAFFDSAGNLTGGGVVPTATISAAMVPVVSATSLTLARQAMGVPPIDAPLFTGDARMAVSPPDGDNDTTLATTAFVHNATIGSFFTTGDLKPTHKSIADPGWILWSDGTIGDASSFASIRQASDTQSLFLLYYSYPDSFCPLFTQAGTLTSRAAQGPGTSAYAAHCRISLPRGAGRALALGGLGLGLTARSVAGFTGTETITQTTDQVGPHQHPPGGSGPFITNDPINNFEITGGGGFGTFAFTGFNAGGNPMDNMQPTAFVNIMVKL